MNNFLLWLQNLTVFTSIAGSSSVWAYPTVLMLHTVGLGWLVGLNTVVNLRVLGVANRFPIRPILPTTRRVQFAGVDVLCYLLRNT